MTYQAALIHESLERVRLGEFRAAERLADQARRSAPFDDGLILFHAKLLLALADARKAVDLLAGSATLRREPDACLMLIGGFLDLGMPNHAGTIVERCLRCFALDALPDPAPLRRACLAGDDHVGWVGLNSSGQIEGSIHREQLDQLTICGGGIAISKIDTVSSRPESDFQDFRAEWPNEGLGPIVISCGDRKLFGAGQLSFPEFFGVSGTVAPMGGRIIGWAMVDWAPHRPAVVRIRDDLGDAAHFTGTLQAHGITRQRTSIDCDVNALGLHGHRFDVELLLPDGRGLPLPGSPLPLPDKAERSRPMPGRRRSSAFAPASAQAPVVIVPISRTLARSPEFRTWLDTIDSIAAERILIVTDDKTGREFRPNAPDTTVEILTVAGDPSLGDLLNAASLHTAPLDIVVLDFRVEVHGDWVRRLARAARSQGNGVVASLSWTGTSSRQLAEADSIAAVENVGLSIETASVMVPCGYITRACLGEIGQFTIDPIQSLAGIIEDFVIRVILEGWQASLAGDVLMDARAIPTGDEASLAHHRDEIARRFPGRFHTLHDDQASRREIGLRHRIAHAWWVAQTPLPAVLLITLAAPQGGVTKHVTEARERFAASGFRTIELKPADGNDDLGYGALSIDGVPDPALRVHLPDEFDSLIDFLKKMRVEKIEFHHFLRLDPIVFQIPSRLDVKFDVTIHDYSWICPRITLIRGNSYCREPDVAECVICVRENGGLLGEDISAAELRDRSDAFLGRAERVIVPSADTENRIRRYFPQLRLSRSAWEPAPDRLSSPPPPPTIEDGEIRVAIFGSIGVHKGFQLISALAEDAGQRDLPIRFVIIGHTEDDSRLAATGRVSITGEYKDAEVGDLLAREKCSVAFFPSIWPETWCYTLTHAMRARLPILATALGAFPERLGDYPNAALFDPGSTNTKDVNRRLTELAKSGGAGHNAAAVEAAEKGLETGLYENQRLGWTSGGRHDPRESVVSNQAVVPMSDAGRPPVTSTIQILNLAEGIYAFSVRGTAQAGPRDGDIAVPAIRISPAPSLVTQGKLTLMSAPSVINDWLTKPGDVVIAQISGGNGQILLTSLSMPNSTPLSIDVRRLDQQSAGAQPPPAGAPMAVPGNPGRQESNLRAFQPQPAPQPQRPVPPGNAGQRRILRTQVLAHIQNRGDVPFAGGGWAGFLGQRLWIEAFALTPLDNMGADALEYKGRTAGGFETPWLSNGAWCGTRGMGVPLVEFAVRLRPQLAANFDCEYSGGFFSGAIGGPSRDGALCRSATPNDPLEAIQIRITEKGGTGLSGGSLISANGTASKG